MCPSYLDGDRIDCEVDPGDTRYFVGNTVQFSRSAGSARLRTGGAWSLKAQQHAGAARRRHPPGSVDVLGAVRLPITRYARRAGSAAPILELPRKEVIQPHLPVRLPCYDFTPVTSPTFDGSLPRGVRPPASGVACFRGVTGGVYKARERIHRGNADPRLLATPPSCRRVSAYNPNRDAL